MEIVRWKSATSLLSQDNSLFSAVSVVLWCTYPCRQFFLRKAIYLPGDQLCVLVIDHGTHLTVDNLMHEKSLATLGKLPADIGPEQIAITVSDLFFLDYLICLS